MSGEITEQLPPCEDMLSEAYRRIWCGEPDPTGRFVCRRVRDHKRDWHVGRNDAGGIHQWQVAGVDARRENMPADMPAPAEQCASHAEEPIGLVRIEQRDGGHSTWQHVGGTPGNEWMCVWSSRGEEGCTLPPDGVAAFPVAGAVPGTPAVSVVDGSGVSVGGELRARCISALAEKPLEFISPDEFGGYDIHYAELVDIVLAEVQPVLAEADRCARRDRYTRDRWGAWWMEMREENKHRLDDAIQAGEEAEQLRAEIARLRGTNEALLAMLERMETLHVTWFGPDGEEYHPEWCRECRVDKAREEAVEKRRVALVTALGGARPAQGFYDAIGDVEDLVAERAALSGLLRGMARRASGQRRSKERLAMWAEGRRPAIPADAVDLLVHAAESCPPGPDHADRLARSYRRFFTAWGLDVVAPPVDSGADTRRPDGATVDNALAGALQDQYGFLPLSVRYGAAAAARAVVERWTSKPVAPEAAVEPDFHITWRAGDLALDRTDFVWWRDQQGWRPIARCMGPWISDGDLGRFVGPLMRLAGLPPELCKSGSVPAEVAARLRGDTTEAPGE